MEENKNFKEVFEKNKAKFGVGAAALILIIILIIVGVVSCSGKNSGSGNVNGGENMVSSETPRDEVPQITPIFMYFVSKNDENYSDYMAVIEELKQEYDGRVEFQTIDIDENPEAKDNFPVDGQTPVLIMNNHDNNITAIEFKCADKEKLAEDIEKSFE